MKRVVAVLAVLALSACATVTDPATGAKTIKPVDFTQTKFAKFTHADFQAAAARATKNGFPARAQMWLAIDALHVANEAQATACAAAIAAALPATGTAPQFSGAADAAEAAAEFIATFTVNPQIKANCEAIPIPNLPPLPGLPKL